MKAVIDIGTNTVLLLVAARDEGGRVQVVRDEARITRLGRGVARSGKLEESAIEHTVEALEEYRELADAHGAMLVPVATEGLRLASNQEAFLTRAEAALGVPVRVISGDEEAELSYLSIAREPLHGGGGGSLRVLDIGGGSTELVVGEGETIVSRQSHRVGSVRLTEQFIDADPPSEASLRAIEDTVREAFATQPLAPERELHGLAGTVTTAAALLLGLSTYDRDRVDGSRWSSELILELRDALAAETVAERSRRPCLPVGRADVIVAGLTILHVALEHCGAETLVVRDRGLRYALV